VRRLGVDLLGLRLLEAVGGTRDRGGHTGPLASDPNVCFEPRNVAGRYHDIAPGRSTAVHDVINADDWTGQERTHAANGHGRQRRRSSSDWLIGPHRRHLLPSPGLLVRTVPLAET
jgi:hypothetical protein